MNEIMIERLKSFSPYVFGVFGVLMARYVIALELLPSLLLYLPCKGLARAVIDNESSKLVESVLLIFLFPPVASSLVEQALRYAGSLNVVRLTEEVKMVIMVFTVLASFGVVKISGRFVAPIFGAWRLPDGVYSVLVRAQLIAACSLSMFAAIYGFRLLAMYGFDISFSLRLVIALLLGCGSVYCIWIVLSTPVVAPLPLGAVRRAADTRSRGESAKAASPTSPSVREVTPPSVRMADVAGMEEVKRQIRLRLIDPVKDAARARKYGIKVGGGMLLYGPPGTGKTFIAKAVAGELGLPFFAITAADVFGRYVGESEGNIRRIFEDIRKHPLSVVFIDELETLFPKRTEEVHETTRKVISLLLQELDGIDEAKNPILLLGATNVPWLIDEAFMRPGRFDVRVFVGLPDFAARRQMFEAAFETGSVPYVSGLTDYLAEHTENYSGADIKGLMMKLRQTAYERRLRAYTVDVVDEVLAQTSPSANGEILASIREWEHTRAR